MYDELKFMKNQENAAIRATFWWPKLVRTETRAVIERPLYGSQRQFAAGMAKHLPQFQFCSKRNWWEADLEQLSVALEIFGSYVRLSEGARAYLKEASA